MSDEKLDLILNVVSDIKNRQEGLEKTFDGFRERQEGLEKTFDGFRERQESLEKTVGEINLKVDTISSRVDTISSRVDNLSNEFTSFKKQVIESFAAVQARFGVLEKQMVAIGVEIKAEIKAEIKIVGENIDRLEKEILFARADAVENRTKVRELETRVARLEHQIGLAV